MRLLSKIKILIRIKIFRFLFSKNSNDKNSILYSSTSTFFSKSCDLHRPINIFFKYLAVLINYLNKKYSELYFINYKEIISKTKMFKLALVLLSVSMIQAANLLPSGRIPVKTCGKYSIFF